MALLQAARFPGGPCDFAGMALTDASSSEHEAASTDDDAETLRFGSPLVSRAITSLEEAPGEAPGSGAVPPESIASGLAGLLAESLTLPFGAGGGRPADGNTGAANAAASAAIGPIDARSPMLPNQDSLASMRPGSEGNGIGLPVSNSGAVVGLGAAGRAGVRAGSGAGRRGAGRGAPAGSRSGEGGGGSGEGNGRGAGSGRGGGCEGGGSYGGGGGGPGVGDGSEADRSMASSMAGSCRGAGASGGASGGAVGSSGAGVSQGASAIKAIRAAAAKAAAAGSGAGGGRGASASLCAASSGGHPGSVHGAALWSSMMDRNSQIVQKGDVDHWEKLYKEAEDQLRTIAFMACKTKSAYDKAQALERWRETLALGSSQALTEKKEPLEFDHDRGEQSRGGMDAGVCHAAEELEIKTPRKRPGYWSEYQRGPRPEGYWTQYGAQRGPRPDGYWTTYESAKKQARTDEHTCEVGPNRRGQDSAAPGQEDELAKTAAREKAASRFHFL